jgi:hypothetical protein
LPREYPRKPISERLTEKLNIPFTIGDMERMRTVAEAAGQNRAAWARDALLAAVAKAEGPDEHGLTPAQYRTKVDAPYEGEPS